MSEGTETSATKSTGVVSKKVAEAEFDRFVEVMDLDVDDDGMDDEDRKSFVDAKRRIVKAMVRGKLVVDEDGQPVLNSQCGTKVTFHSPSGAAFMAMDQKKKNHDVSKLFAAMASMTGQPLKCFSNMDGPDVKICTAIAGLFLG